MTHPHWSPCNDAIHLAPSLLAGDFGHLADSVAAIEGSGVERLHVDIRKKAKRAVRQMDMPQGLQLTPPGAAS